MNRLILKPLWEFLGIEPTPLPRFCKNCGRELTTVWASDKVIWNPDTGEGTRKGTKYLRCPKYNPDPYYSGQHYNRAVDKRVTTLERTGA